MGNANVIVFSSRERLIAKAQYYARSSANFLQEREQAVPLLLKVIKYADKGLKRKIIQLLGSWAKEEVAEPLYHILGDPAEDDTIRRDASIQLSAIFPSLGKPASLIDRLIEKLENPDPDMRRHAAFALGWERNDRAAIPLIALLYDRDVRVQQTAVNAISNLRDDRLLNLLLERLEHGPSEQKRAILFNLWRYYGRHKEVIAAYRKYLRHENADLRFDALALLAVISEPGECLEDYRCCLKDDDARIRELALKELNHLDSNELHSLKAEIALMLDDPQIEVKQAAMEVLKKL